MCYSAMEDNDLAHLSTWGATEEIRLAAFAERARRSSFPSETKIKFSRAFEAAIERRADNPAFAETAEVLRSLREQRRTELETGLFTQKTRQVKAERALADRPTKKAAEDKRISATKIDWHLKQLARLDSTEIRDSERRIYPMWHTMVVANVDGKRTMMPMRYHCRQAGKPASIDKHYDGLYNARRDSLEGYWKKVWGRQHGILIARAFYENVAAHDFERRPLGDDERPQNVVLEFKPDTLAPMLFACLWDKWSSPGEPDLYSFAVITDEPPPEIAATGHDRCPIPLKPENVRAWLSPEARTKDDLQAILDDRERPHYEHRKAA